MDCVAQQVHVVGAAKTSGAGTGTRHSQQLVSLELYQIHASDDVLFTTEAVTAA